MVRYVDMLKAKVVEEKALARKLVGLGKKEWARYNHRLPLLFLPSLRLSLLPLLPPLPSHPLLTSLANQSLFFFRYPLQRAKIMEAEIESASAEEEDES